VSDEDASSDPIHLRQSMERAAQRDAEAAEAGKRMERTAQELRESNLLDQLLLLWHWASKNQARQTQETEEIREAIRQLVALYEALILEQRNTSKEMALLRQQCRLLGRLPGVDAQLPMAPPSSISPATTESAHPAPPPRVPWWKELWESASTKLALRVILAGIGLLFAGIAAWKGWELGSQAVNLVPLP